MKRTIIYLYLIQVVLDKIYVFVENSSKYTNIAGIRGELRCTSGSFNLNGIGEKYGTELAYNKHDDILTIGGNNGRLDTVRANGTGGIVMAGGMSRTICTAGSKEGAGTAGTLNRAGRGGVFSFLGASSGRGGRKASKLSILTLAHCLDPILVNLQDEFNEEELIVEMHKFYDIFFHVVIPNGNSFIYGIYQGANKLYEFNWDSCEKIVVYNNTQIPLTESVATGFPASALEEGKYFIFLRVIDRWGRDTIQRFIAREGIWILDRASLTYTDPIGYIAYSQTHSHYGQASNLGFSVTESSEDELSEVTSGDSDFEESDEGEDL